MHCALIQAGELQAVVGDASRNGVGGIQYCGVWSLTSVHRVFNAFGNSYAGLIPGEIRGKAPSLRGVDASPLSYASPFEIARILLRPPISRSTL